MIWDKAGERPNLASLSTRGNVTDGFRFEWLQYLTYMQEDAQGSVDNLRVRILHAPTLSLS